MICIGAGFSGLKGARAFTVDLIDVTRRSLAVFFETDTSNVCDLENAGCALKTQMRNTGLITAALITTVAGTLSGHQRTFELAEVSRGLLIHVRNPAPSIAVMLRPRYVGDRDCSNLRLRQLRCINLYRRTRLRNVGADGLRWNRASDLGCPSH